MISRRWNTILFSPLNPYKERIMRWTIGKRCDFHKTHWSFFLFCCSFRCMYVLTTYSTQYWWAPQWIFNCHQEVLRVLGFWWMGHKRQNFTWNPSIRTMKVQIKRISICINACSISFALVGYSSKSPGWISLPIMKIHHFFTY